MSKEKKLEILTKDQEQQLQKMVNDMLDVAANLVQEYEDLDISELQELSGSITQINEESPFLDEVFKGKSWKKVIKNISATPKSLNDNDNK